MKRYLCLALSVVCTVAQRPIYWGGDYASAGLYSLGVAYNLTNAIANTPADKVMNSSDTFISQIRGLQKNLDVLGAGGFAYAYQDKIPSLFDSDELAIETSNMLSTFKNDLISQLEMLYQRRGKMDCVSNLLNATDTLDAAFAAWVNYF
jgi:hypothetical protein